ncbi:helix-turn-helix domain-containing protein [Actinomadura formosensis]|uniref:helix-turn-helix domain-containing protein n=1 Tax=Actinomadura formosensis TaxID=60706 RepID=UPI003D941FC0
MDERPEQRPEGALIAAALKRSRMSQRQAAALASISENRLRAIVHGYQSVGAGAYAPVRGPADTVARIADAVGVTPEQLESVGRGDAARELRLLAAERAGDEAAEEEDEFARMDRLYEQWKRDPERGPALRTILESWGERDTG